MAQLAADWRKALEKGGGRRIATDGKSNGIPAMAALLDLLDIKGAVVTADAMHAQRNTAEPVTGKGGDCALA